MRRNLKSSSKFIAPEYTEISKCVYCSPASVEFSPTQLTGRSGRSFPWHEWQQKRVVSSLYSALQALLCRSEWKTEHMRVKICMNELAGYCALLGLSIRHRDLWGIGRFSASFFFLSHNLQARPVFASGTVGFPQLGKVNCIFLLCDILHWFKEKHSVGSRCTQEHPCQMCYFWYILHFVAHSVFTLVLCRNAAAKMKSLALINRLRLILTCDYYF